MSEIPKGAIGRTAKLASLPLSAAGRMTKGWGQRLLGADSAEVSADLQRRTAEQLFEVLGTLKGGAMKFGQALSVYEAAIPDEYSEPYRQALRKLQNAAPPMEIGRVHRVLAEQLGAGWREHFAEFDDVAAAAASIGQVHRGVWKDGREVAIKVQYPRAEAALRSDLAQLTRVAPIFGLLVPGVAVRPLLEEMRDRLLEELDYRREADHQRAFAAEFAGDEQIYVPRVVASAPKVLVSEWVHGQGLASVIDAGSAEQRNRAGRLLTELHFSAPARVGLLHSDPHPGNYLLTPDGRLGVIDFGSVAELPNGSPPVIGQVSRLALDRRAEDVLTLLRREGFVPARFELDPTELMDYVAPFVEPLRHKTFHFTRQWMQQQASRMTNLSSPESKIARSLALPPHYLMIHRVTFGSIGVLCQLDANAPFRDIAVRWQPGFDLD